MIPKISLDTMLEVREELNSSSLEKTAEKYHIIEEEQGDAMLCFLTSLALLNPQFFKGFLLCYMSIHRTLKNKEVEELEKMVKGE